MKGTLASRFEELNQKRHAKLRRARRCAELTIPSLLPPEGYVKNQSLPIPQSSTAAKGATSLASKMTSAILPINGMSYFMFGIDPAGIDDTEDVTEEEAQLARYERMTVNKLAATNLRSQVYEATLHLIVVGDCLFYEADDYTFQVFRLDQYVVRRYPNGNVKEIILQEWVDPDTLPDHYKVSSGPVPPSNPTINEDGFEPLYTRILDKNGEWNISREFRGHMVETDKTYKVCPYIPLRWAPQSGQDYGRSLVEENFGDIEKLDSLTESLDYAMAAMAESRIGVDPAGITEIDDLNDSENLSFVPARKEDLFNINFQTAANVAPILEAVIRFEDKIDRIFLRNVALQLRGERVTATQVRAAAQELEDALGGVFSSVASDILQPVIRRTLLLMEDDNTLPSGFTDLLGKDGILTVKIVTGLNALGRELENAKLSAGVEFLRALPAEAQAQINWDVLIKRWFTSSGIEIEGLVKSAEQIQQEQQAAQAAMIAQQAAQQTIASGGKIAEQQLLGDTA